MSISNIFFHDGNLISVIFENGIRCRATLTLGLYDTLGSSKRECWSVVVDDLIRIAFIGDTTEMRNNSFAGEIADGCILEECNRHIIRLSLCGGYLELIGSVVFCNKTGDVP